LKAASPTIASEKRMPTGPESHTTGMVDPNMLITIATR